MKRCPEDTDSRGTVWESTPAGTTKEKECSSGFVGKKGNVVLFRLFPFLCLS